MDTILFDLIWLRSLPVQPPCRQPARPRSRDNSESEIRWNWFHKDELNGNSSEFSCNQKASFEWLQFGVITIMDYEMWHLRCLDCRGLSTGNFQRFQFSQSAFALWISPYKACRLDTVEIQKNRGLTIASFIKHENKRVAFFSVLNF